MRVYRYTDSLDRETVYVRCESRTWVIEDTGAGQVQDPNWQIGPAAVQMQEVPERGTPEHLQWIADELQAISKREGFDETTPWSPYELRRKAKRASAKKRVDDLIDALKRCETDGLERWTPGDVIEALIEHNLMTEVE
jgi:hypothetical protein